MSDPRQTPAAMPLSEAQPRPTERDDAPCAACPVRDRSVCGALDDEEMRYLNDIMETMSMVAGDHLVDEGEPAKHVFNITEGTLKIFRLMPDGRRQVMGFLFPGDFLGLVARETYLSSAEAVTDVTLCRFRREQIEDLEDRLPKLESRLLRMARNELAEGHDQMLLLGRKTAMERLASFLLNLQARAERRGDPVNPVHVPMSREDIGDYLGLTTETVSRTMTRLKQSGLIAQEPDRRILIRKRDELVQVAEGY